MKHKIILAIFCFTLAATAFSQKKTNFQKKVDHLKSLLTHADTISYELADSVNVLISKQLVSVLSDPELTRYKPDSVLHHPFLDIIHSPDRKFWVFSWYENTGGTFQSYLSVIYYRTGNNKVKVQEVTWGDNADNFPGWGGTFSEIHTLPHPSRQLYLCIGFVKGCSTCCANIAAVIELTKDGINFGYPAFGMGDEIDHANEGPSSFVLRSRCGSVENFEYDPKTTTIYYSYTPDDETPISPEEANRVTGTIKWNDKYFEIRETKKLP